MRAIYFHLVLPTLITLINVFGASLYAPANQTSSAWAAYENISNTSVASTYPAAVGDREGNVHVVWVEDYGGTTSNPIFNADGSPLMDYRGKQVNLLTDVGNTLTYSRWDGTRWHTPTDIQVATDGRIQFPSITVDTSGILHVIWLTGSDSGQNLMYSRSPISEAEQVRSWSKAIALAADVLSVYYPASITADSKGGLQIVYYKIGANPGVFAIQSVDGGNSWSSPTLLYGNFSTTGDGDGSLPVRSTIDDNDQLHATWTRYDRTGNGRSIYYAQSPAQSMAWSEPVEISAWQRGWYEVDWLSVGTVGDQIHVVWEGGTQAYINERISSDGGQTWSPEQRILPGLVGENGWADLVTDGSGNLHLVVTKRATQSNFTTYGVWHATWLGDQWSSPVLVGLPDSNQFEQIDRMQPDTIRALLRGTIMGDGLRYQRSVIVNGNELVTVVVNEYDGELYSSHILLPSTRVERVPYLTATAFPTSTVTNAETTISATPTLQLFTEGEPVETASLNGLLFWGIAPAVLFIAGSIFIFKFAKQRRL